MEMVTVLIGKRKFKDTSEGSHSAKTESSLKDEKNDGKGSKPSEYNTLIYNLLISKILRAYHRFLHKHDYSNKYSI